MGAFAMACSRDAVTAPVKLAYGLVRISPTMLTYGAGNDVRLEIENVGPTVLATSVCPTALEISTGDKWDTVAGFTSNCDASYFRLDPGTIGPGELLLPAALRTGLYRARYDRISAVDESLVVNRINLIGAQHSESFAVTAAAFR
jgi:hypothetical protein